MVTEEEIDALAQDVCATFLKAGYTLGTAESCTGGGIGSALTRIAGASALFKGGIISYANEIKSGVLGVSLTTLATQGAVSDACACEMARGARRVLGVDCAVSVTGIAGPGGGTSQKPVGTVWFGVATASEVTATVRHFAGDRAEIRRQAVATALLLVKAAALKQSSQVSAEKRPTVLITGGRVRIGAAISAQFQAAGWRVLRVSHRADAGAEYVADLSKAEAVDDLWCTIARDLSGAPDVLVNNAALYRGEAALLEQMNFKTPERLTELMAAASAESTRPGCVVNILDARASANVSSVADQSAAAAYDRTKASLAAGTRAAAQKFLGVLRVNGVAPGPVLPPVDHHEAAGHVPFGRPTPQDIAQSVFYCATTSTLTGNILFVDSGMHLNEGEKK